MINAVERSRYDTSMSYAKRAYPFFQNAFNKDNKIPNLIAAFVMLDCAIRCLGEKTIQAALEEDPSIRDIVAAAQAELPSQIKKFADVETAGEPNNIIHVDFAVKLQPTKP